MTPNHGEPSSHVTPNSRVHVGVKRDYIKHRDQGTKMQKSSENGMDMKRGLGLCLCFVGSRVSMY